MYFPLCPCLYAKLHQSFLESHRYPSITQILIIVVIPLNKTDIKSLLLLDFVVK